MCGRRGPWRRRFVGGSQPAEGETGQVKICNNGTMTIIDQPQNQVDNPEGSLQKEMSPMTLNMEQEGENSGILEGHEGEKSDPV
ncbi:hypothetical protein NDU88_002459 [Pleurodeles waltl]|uniref:Uncharacterized protein n=1 Tax=Pleurodeles waltl TaxID=8319 RepID=A0AAV7NH77_PLEWA|nr:hypothetical protein NDU88_002459 [Pleurodeles waltl]